MLELMIPTARVLQQMKTLPSDRQLVPGVSYSLYHIPVIKLHVKPSVISPSLSAQAKKRMEFLAPNCQTPLFV